MVADTPRGRAQSLALIVRSMLFVLLVGCSSAQETLDAIPVLR